MKRFGWFVILLMTLIGFQTVAAQSAFQPGDKVIFMARNSSVYTSAASTDTNAGEISRGVITQIMQVDPSAHRIYVIDHAFGWVDDTVDGQPSLVPYDENTLHEIEAQAQADMTANPSATAPYVVAALIANQDKRRQEAVDLLTSALVQSPNDGYLLYQRGKIYLDLDSWLNAEDDFGAAEAANYKIASLYNCLGIASEGLKDTDYAITQFQMAIGIASTWGLLYSNLANQYDNQGSYQEAINSYTTAIQLDPLLGLAYRNRSHVYQDIQNFDASLADMNAAIQLAPFDPRGYVNRADFYVEVTQDYDSAYADYDAALAIDPRYGLAYLDRAITYVGIGEVEKALADFKQALDIDPDDPDTLYNLASLYAALGNYTVALQEYTRVVDLDGNHAYSALLYRPQLYFASGDYQAALDDLNMYIDGNPSQYFAVTAYIERAAAFAHEGRYTEARYDLLSALADQDAFTKSFYQYGGGYRVTPQRTQEIAQLNLKVTNDPSDAQSQLDLGLLAMQFGVWQIAHDSFAQYGTLTNITGADFTSFLTTLQQLAS
ncbi:MAG: tetratricopeptide repeat protein [Chloroflexota bacterium]